MELPTELGTTKTLGRHLIGYLFPPGNFVGDQPETIESPWAAYENTTGGGHDRFGYGHADDSESVGPYAGLAVTHALSGLLSQSGPGNLVVPGLFVDVTGTLCDSPFPATTPEAGSSWVTGCTRFTGAVGVRVDEGGRQQFTVGTNASGWATYLATTDTGTAGTAYPYSTATRGVILANGVPLLIDVVRGAEDPVVTGVSG